MSSFACLFTRTRPRRPLRRAAHGFLELVLPAALAILATLAIAPTPLRAGECTQGNEDYLSALERISKERSVENAGAATEAINCLRCEAEDPTRWAGPIAATTFQQCRKSPIRDRLSAACLPLLADTTALPNYRVIPRFSCAVLLASYGIPRLGEDDIFHIVTVEIPKRRPLATTDFMALAALRDPRTLRFLATEYDADAKMPSPRRERRVEDIVNCLYHVPGDSALALVRTIHEKETDPLIKDRCMRVLGR